jgi:hypothetical protein
MDTDIRFIQAQHRFFIDGMDLMGQHKTAEDLAFSMQFEIDLYNEGQEDTQIKTVRDLRRAKKFVSDFSKKTP